MDILPGKLDADIGYQFHVRDSEVSSVRKQNFQRRLIKSMSRHVIIRLSNSPKAACLQRPPRSHIILVTFTHQLEAGYRLPLPCP